MALNTDKNLKLYYSIKEVAAKFGLRESTLRFWEKEFPMLQPKTSGQGIRRYTEKDIELLNTIHNLVKVRGFKLAAARKYVEANHTSTKKNVDVIEKLTSVRDQLLEIKQRMDMLR